MTTTLLSRFFFTLGAFAVTSLVHLVSHNRPQSVSSSSSSSSSSLLRQQQQQHGTTTGSSISLEDARKGLITDLPGLDYELNFRQYSGYLPVTGVGRHIFYWYVESQSDPDHDPVVFWTNGGPGCSGLIAFGAEHGPFIIDAHGLLTPNPYAWNRVANVLYVEQPVGVGFSYSNASAHPDYTTGDHAAAVDNVQVIRAFLERFPERKFNDFYLASESYGGHYMPQLALEILRTNTDGFINFKGMMVGNPFVDPFSNAMAEIQSYYSHGLVPAPLFQEWVQGCTTPSTFDNDNCTTISETIFDLAGDGINPYALDFPVCREGQWSGGKEATSSSSSASAASASLLGATTTTTSSTTSRRHHHRFLSSQVAHLWESKPRGRTLRPRFLPEQDRYKPCAELHTEEFLNHPDVRRALHVIPSNNKHWSPCANIHYSEQDINTPQIHLYRELVTMALAQEHALNILVYSGDDDSVCALAGTQAWIWDLGVIPIVNKHTWVPWLVDDQTAGYVTHFDLGGPKPQSSSSSSSSSLSSSSNGATSNTNGPKLAFATVHGAGHEVPAYRPMEALELFKKFLSGKW